MKITFYSPKILQARPFSLPSIKSSKPIKVKQTKVHTPTQRLIYTAYITIVKVIKQIVYTNTTKNDHKKQKISKILLPYKQHFCITR